MDAKYIKTSRQTQNFSNGILQAVENWSSLRLKSTTDWFEKSIFSKSSSNCLLQKALGIIAKFLSNSNTGPSSAAPILLRDFQCFIQLKECTWAENKTRKIPRRLEKPFHSNPRNLFAFSRAVSNAAKRRRIAVSWMQPFQDE